MTRCAQLDSLASADLLEAGVVENVNEISFRVNAAYAKRLIIMLVPHQITFDAKAWRATLSKEGLAGVACSPGDHDEVISRPFHIWKGRPQSLGAFRVGIDPLGMLSNPLDGSAKLFSGIVDCLAIPATPGDVQVMVRWKRDGLIRENDNVVTEHYQNVTKLMWHWAYVPMRMWMAPQAKE
jgi:hypothetical protein